MKNGENLAFFTMQNHHFCLMRFDLIWNNAVDTNCGHTGFVLLINLNISSKVLKKSETQFVTGLHISTIFEN